MSSISALTTQVDEVCAELDRDGYALVEDVMAPDAVARAHAELTAIVASTPYGRDDFEGHRTRRVYALFGKTRAMDGAAIDPLVLGVLDRVLGTYQLSAPTGIEIGAGETAQGLHPDDALYPVPRPHGELVVNVMWPLEDFTDCERHDTRDPRKPSVGVAATHARRRAGCRRDARRFRAHLPRQPVARWRCELDGASAAGCGVALRGRLAATGREPRPRGAAGRRAAPCPNGCRSSSATTSSRRSSATSTAATRSACSTPERRGSRRSPRQNGRLSLDRCSDARYELWFAVGRTRGKAHEMMQRFWSVLAVTLGKRAGLVSVIGLLVTLVLGFGITKLDFATGQDSYLNKGDQVYKDNVAYQDLFGGQAMLTVITMDDGHTVDELFTAENREQLQQFHDELLDAGTLHGVITPLTIARVRGLARAERQRRPHREHRGWGAADRVDEGSGRIARAGGAPRGRGHDPRAHQRGPGRTAHVRQPRVGELPPLRQRGRHPARAPLVHPRPDRTRRS